MGEPQVHQQLRSFKYNYQLKAYVLPQAIHLKKFLNDCWRDVILRGT